MKFAPVFLACVIAVVSAGTPWVGEPRNDDNWLAKHRGFVDNTRNSNGSQRVLFYGDSITEGWLGAGRPTYDQYYVPIGIANYGISGDRVEHVLWRIQDGEVTDNLNPSVCVIKIGTNNLGANTDNDIAMSVVFEVNELRERLPNMKILLLGVLPRNNEANTVRTSNINEIIKHLDNGRTIRFLDMKDHFYRGGNDFVTELYTSDLLHLTAAGYAKWAEVMDPLFREMLNSN